MQLTLDVLSQNFTPVPNLTQTLTVPANSGVYIATHGGGQTTGVASNDFSTIDIAVFVDGVVTVNGLFRRVICANTAGIIAVVCNWSMSGVIPLAAGPHTITVQARLIQANAIAVVSGNNGSVLQGALTVMVLKQ